jgi:hypothetical protein
VNSRNPDFRRKNSRSRETEKSLRFNYTEIFGSFQLSGSCWKARIEISTAVLIALSGEAEGQKPSRKVLMLLLLCIHSEKAQLYTQQSVFKFLQGLGKRHAVCAQAEKKPAIALVSP